MILPSNVIHVIPVNDLKKHKEYCTYRDRQLPICKCACKPEHKEIGNDDEGITAMVIVHNSFDGREGVEWANEILKQ